MWARRGPLQGVGENREELVLLADREVGLRFDGPTPTDVGPLRQALRQPGVDVWSGVTVGEQEPFDNLDLYQMTVTPGFCMLAAEKSAFDHGVVNASWRVPSPAVVEGDSSPTGCVPAPSTTVAPATSWASAHTARARRGSRRSSPTGFGSGTESTEVSGHTSRCIRSARRIMNCPAGLSSTSVATGSLSPGPDARTQVRTRQQWPAGEPGCET